MDYSYEGEDQEEFAHVRGSLASAEDADKYHRFQPKVSGSRSRGSKASQSSTAAHTAAPVAACMADRYEHSLNVMEHTVAPPEPMASKFPRIDASALDPPMDSKRLLVKRKRGVEPAEGIVLERRKRRKVSLLSAIENLSISEEPKPSRKRKFYKLEEPGERISAPSDFVAKRATDQRASATTEEEMQGIPEEVLLMWKQHLHKTNPAEADASNYVVDVYVEQEPEDMEREMANYRTMFVEEFPTELVLQDEYDSDQIESDDPDGQEVDYPDEEDDIFLTSDEDGGYSSDARDTAYHSDYNNLETDEDEADSDDGHRHARSWWG